MTDALGKIPGLEQLAGLADMGGDALLTVLSGVVEALGQGTEFTGEQIDKLGELQQQLADKVASLR